MKRTNGLRLLKFSLVGAIGIGVQLGVLAALIATGINYLLATALAVECAVIHNFLWHRRFTWADRAGSGMRDFLMSLLLFHLSNGLISLVGNVLLMRLLAGWLRLPVLRANIVTIAACFIANFLASDRWVFLLHRAERSDRLANRNASSLGGSISGRVAVPWRAPASVPGYAVRMEHK